MKTHYFVSANTMTKRDGGAHGSDKKYVGRILSHSPRHHALILTYMIKLATTHAHIHTHTHRHTPPQTKQMVSKASRSLVMRPRHSQTGPLRQEHVCFTRWPSERENVLSSLVPTILAQLAAPSLRD